MRDVVRNRPEQNVPCEDAFELLGNSGPIKVEQLPQGSQISSISCSEILWVDSDNRNVV